MNKPSFKGMLFTIQFRFGHLALTLKKVSVQFEPFYELKVSTAYTVYTIQKCHSDFKLFKMMPKH